MPTNGKRNKRAGNTHEQDEVKRHKRYFCKIGTTRFFNRKRDHQGIDICNEDESEVGRLPLDISCKSAAKANISYVKLIEGMQNSDRIKVVLHRYTQKPDGGKNFVTQGEYAIVNRAGYEQLLQHVYAIQLLRQLVPGTIENIEKKYELNLLSVLNQTNLETPAECRIREAKEKAERLKKLSTKQT